jgi:hypothetical protein
LWIADVQTRKSRCLIRSDPSPDAEKNLREVYGPHFSPDGRSVYVTAASWVTDGAIHKVDVASGKERFVAAGELQGVIIAGPYNGDLLVRRHTPWPAPEIGYHYPAWVVDTAGRNVLRVPGMDHDDESDHISLWLKETGSAVQ